MIYFDTRGCCDSKQTQRLQLPQYKFSVKKDHSSSVTVAFMKGDQFEYMDRNGDNVAGVYQYI